MDQQRAHDIIYNILDTLNRMDKRLHPPIMTRGLFGWDVYRFCRKWSTYGY